MVIVSAVLVIFLSGIIINFLFIDRNCVFVILVTLLSGVIINFPFSLICSKILEMLTVVNGSSNLQIHPTRKTVALCHPNVKSQSPIGQLKLQNAAAT